MTETSTPSRPRISFMIGDPAKETARVSFVLNGKWRSYLLASAQGQKLAELLRADPQDIETIGELADIPTWIAKMSHGRVTVDDCERLRLDGKLIDFGLSGRITKIVERGIPFSVLANFVELLDQNPDPTVKEDLYRFMEKGDLLPDPDGWVLGFKKVDENYLSYASGQEAVKVFAADSEEPEVMQGRVKYPVGGRLEMNREDCDPNRQRTCSRGLHVCSYEYLNFWYKQKGVVLIVRVNPKDVTAIPADHNDQKLRCCGLEILAEIPEAEAQTYFARTIDERYPSMVAETPAPEAQDDEDVLDLTPEMAVDSDDVSLESVEDEPPAEDPEAAPKSPADWSAQGYRDGLEAGMDDRRNGYDYGPSFEAPEEIAEDEKARAAYSQSFVTGYDVGFRDVAVEPDDAD